MAHGPYRGLCPQGTPHLGLYLNKMEQLSGDERILICLIFYNVFSRFDTMPECQRQTDI